MTNSEILQIAMRQSAVDMNCVADDFVRRDNVIVQSKALLGARKYLSPPFSCRLVSYGTNVVASIDMRYREAIESYINVRPAFRCFETPHIYALNDIFAPYGMRVCGMAEYFLPNVDGLPNLSCGCELRVLTQPDFAELYVPQWSNALCANRKHLDVLGVGAYSGGELVGLAACSADCDGMWQIGVDVLPETRRRGIACALTSRLAKEILSRGKVPFYCCAWSNVASARNAIKSGFRPAWVELGVATGGAL